MHAAAPVTDGGERGTLTAEEAGTWLLWNLAVLLGAFVPSVVLLMMIGSCAGAPRGERCGTGIVADVVSYWVMFAVPACIMGGAHLCVVLPVAWRWPLAGRVAAATFPFAVLLPRGGVEALIQKPGGVLVVGLAGVAYALMLRLDPREPLADASWVWCIAPTMAVVAVLFSLAGVV